MSEIDYQKDLEINQNELILECRNQPKILMKYSKLKSIADRKVKNLRKDISLLKALVARLVRENPRTKRSVVNDVSEELKSYLFFSQDIGLDWYQLDKITDASVKEFVECHPGIDTKERELIEAEYEYSVISGMVSSIEDRSYRLTNIVDLVLRNYDATNINQAESRLTTQADAFKQHQLDQLNKKG